MILMGKENGKDTATGLRQPYAGHVQAFLSSAPTFVPPIEPSLHVWSEYPSLHTAPIGLPCPVERWELPQGRAECHPRPSIVPSITCFPYQYQSHQLPSQHLRIRVDEDGCDEIESKYFPNHLSLQILKMCRQCLQAALLPSPPSPRSSPRWDPSSASRSPWSSARRRRAAAPGCQSIGRNRYRATTAGARRRTRRTASR